jgi:hypothetical protein
MSDDDTPRPATVTRRDTLRLAAAVGALGAGLGTLLESEEAQAASVKLDQKSLGALAIKVYDEGGKAPVLLKTFDLAQLIKLSAAGKLEKGYSVKLYYVQHKTERSQVLASNKLKVASTYLKIE